MNNQTTVKTKPNDSIEVLRQILEAKQRRPVTYSEALEVGESLVNFFKVLAGAI